MYMTGNSSSYNRCGIVLAGGDGCRLKPFVHQLRGNSLPKQYVNIIGTRSMIEHAFARAEKVIPRERIFTVVNRDHLSHPEARQQLSTRSEGTVVVQPANRDTYAGVLLPLMHICKHYPGATVVLFPSDHFIVEEHLFVSYVDLALLAAEQDPSRVVLLGIEPDRPETEYGYILPDGELTNSVPLYVRKIQGFVEKPDPTLAKGIIAQGGLWNTMVMIFNSDTMLDLIHRLSPEMYDAFQEILTAIGSRQERQVVNSIYGRMKSRNFSEEVLEPLAFLHPSTLSVLPISGVFWSDWGSKTRIVSSLKRTGKLNRLQGVSESLLFQIWSEAL
jgi:mannose-1-phosphate guanylyltransferase